MEGPAQARRAGAGNGAGDGAGDGAGERAGTAEGHWMAPLLAPWAEVPDGPSVAVVNLEGLVIAGAIDPAGGPVSVALAITADGAPVATLAASGGDPDTVARLRPALHSLAITLGELLGERAARAAADQALRDHRSADAAAALGVDARELAKGRRQQRSILTLQPPEVPGYEMATHYAPAREIGGDFFELFLIPRRGRPLGITIADVTGKGLDAALLMAFARPVLHTALVAARSPSEALARTNHVLAAEHRGTLFITALAAVLRPARGRLTLASAGHEAPLLVPADGGPIREVGRAGVLLGAWETIAEPEVDLVLSPGDALVLYTDGVPDTRNLAGERFGDARLHAALDESRGMPADAIADHVRDCVATFRGAAEPADDLTLVVVRRKPRVRRVRRARAMVP